MGVREKIGPVNVGTSMLVSEYFDLVRAVVIDDAATEPGMDTRQRMVKRMEKIQSVLGGYNVLTQEQRNEIY